MKINPKIRKLLDEALEAAHTAGMEAAAELEGCSWTGKGLEAADATADAAREVLERALGLSKAIL